MAEGCVGAWFSVSTYPPSAFPFPKPLPVSACVWWMWRNIRGDNGSGNPVSLALVDLGLIGSCTVVFDILVSVVEIDIARLEEVMEIGVVNSFLLHRIWFVSIESLCCLCGAARKVSVELNRSNSIVTVTVLN